MKANAGKLLFSADDEFGHIEIREKKNKRWMHFGSPGIHTAINLDDPSELVLKYLNPMVGCIHLLPQLNNVLILGLGGGSLAHYLLKKHPTVSIDAVERSQLIIDLAHKYFMLPTDNSKLNIHCTNAEDFIKNTDKKYDLILVDTSDAEKVPEACTTDEFTHDCYESLSKSGFMSINIFSNTLKQFENIIYRVRKEFFCHTICFPIDGFSNLVICAGKTDEFEKLLKLNRDDYFLVSPQYDPEYGLLASAYKIS